VRQVGLDGRFGLFRRCVSLAPDMEHAAVALSVAARAGISKKRPRPDLSTFLPTDPVNASDEGSQSSSQPAEDWHLASRHVPNSFHAMLDEIQRLSYSYSHDLKNKRTFVQ
jgi:hypothetical protein